MPGLVACGRRWQLSGDDLPIPALVDLCWRIFWLTVIGGVCLYHMDQWHGVELSECLIGFLGYVVAAVVGLIFDLPLIIVGTRGTVINATPRSHMVELLYLRLAVVTLEMPCYGYATYAAFNQRTLCPPHLEQFFKVLSVLPWVIVPVLLLYVFSVYDPAGRPKDNPRNKDVQASDSVRGLFRSPTEKGARRQWKSWIRRVKLLLCCSVGFDKEDQESYQRAADMLCAIFQDIDVVPSDLVASLVLLRKKQKKLLARTGSCTGNPRGPQLVPFASVRVSDSPTATTVSTNGTMTRRSWMTVENAPYFLRFAWASYGWYTYMLSHPCTWLCTLWSGMRCCSCMRESGGGEIIGDNCCECNAAAVRTLAKVRAEDLLYCSFENGVYKVPFFVTLDHESRSVLVVVRGTASLDDLLTDLSMTHEVLQGLEGLGVTGGRCNIGVLRSARHILPFLEGPLQEAFRRHPHYRLVLTGHSLGGSVTAVLALILRSRYRDVQCYAYSPTAIFDSDLAKASKDCVLSVVVGDDAVVRAGIAQLLDLKRQSLQVFLECDQPKHKLLSQFCLAVCCGGRITPKSYSPETVHVESGNSVKESTVTQIINDALANQPRYPMLYPPGTILYLARSSAGFSTFCAPAEYFDHIVLSPKMFSDHLPDAIMRALRSVQEQSLVHHF